MDDRTRHLLDASLPLAAPPAQHKEVKIDPNLLDVYVGRYELAPNFHPRRDPRGRPALHPGHRPAEVPALRRDEEDFFLKVVDAQITFVADETGKVTKLILHQAGDHEAKRIE